MTSIGIRHVHLLVAEHDRAIAFYREVFGMEERFREDRSSSLGHLVEATHSRFISQQPMRNVSESASRVDGSTSASTCPIVPPIASMPRWSG